MNYINNFTVFIFKNTINLKFNLKRHQQTKKCIKFQNKKELKERNDLELKDKEISLLKHEIALNEKAIKLKDKEIELLKKQIQDFI